jgi:hypothetical protein
LDPQAHSSIPVSVLQSSRHAMAGGLIWVFVAMLIVAILQLAVSALMANRRSGHTVRASEAIEAMAG